MSLRRDEPELFAILAMFGMLFLTIVICSTVAEVVSCR